MILAKKPDKIVYEDVGDGHAVARVQIHPTGRQGLYKVVNYNDSNVEHSQLIDDGQDKLNNDQAIPKSFHALQMTCHAVNWSS